ncbi:MAG: transglycosylase SLT domain-containing protein [Myxococcota bacterium]|nr:transglycosylase SLT domain-containing protein [Myxococcota bacterium]
MIAALTMTILAASSQPPEVDEMQQLKVMESAFFAAEAHRAKRHETSSKALNGWKLKRAFSHNIPWPKQSLSSSLLASPPALDIPWTMNQHVAAYMRFFQGRGRRTFQVWLDRSALLIPVLRPILHEVGAPRDLVYLAMIESGFRARARSSAGAQGVWQFIPATARAFGLKTGHFVDERADLDQATRAAARYLLTLHDRFGDWYLAWAAYNAGPGRVRRAQRLTSERDFWGIASELPRETRNYVPKLLAAATLAQRPQHYGFRRPSAEQAISTKTMPISRPLALTKIAEVCGVDGDLLWHLNPMLKQGITPPEHLYGKAFELRVPQATPEDCVTRLKKLPVQENRHIQTYRVRRGDTLSGIAKRWGARILEIARANNITTRSTLRLGQKLIIPIPVKRKR